MEILQENINDVMTQISKKSQQSFTAQRVCPVILTEKSLIYAKKDDDNLYFNWNCKIYTHKYTIITVRSFTE